MSLRSCNIREARTPHIGLESILGQSCIQRVLPPLKETILLLQCMPEHNSSE